jgi:hypothetical protein
MSRSPSLNRATRASGPTPNAENIRPRPPVPTPTSTRPPLSWSSEVMLLARWTGLCSGVTNTAQPSRSRSVHAAAYVIVSTGPRCGIVPRTCSCVQPLWKPSPSARVR